MLVPCPPAHSGETPVCGCPLDQAVSRLASQPRDAAIQRRTHRVASRAGSQGSQWRGSASAPQRYRLSSLFQDKATHAPRQRRESQMPSGQGSAAQHTPQPLQGAPCLGLGGAAGWIKITRAEKGCGIGPTVWVRTG